MKSFSIASPHKSRLWYDYRLYANLINSLEELGYKYRRNSVNRIYFLGAPRRHFYPDVGKFDKDANNIALVYCHFELIESFNEYSKVFLSSPFVLEKMKTIRKNKARLFGKNPYIQSLRNVDIIRPFSSLSPRKEYQNNLNCDISFIGSPRIRPIVEDIIPIVKKHRLSFHIYGPDWHNYKGNDDAISYVKAREIPYGDIPLLSHNSKISLVDHHQSMNELGTVSHKYVDLIMSGAFVISDFNKDAAEHYNGIVYQDRNELEEIVLTYLNDISLRSKVRTRQYQVTKNQTTLEAAKVIAKSFI